MTWRSDAGRMLVGLGSTGLFATAVFHLKDYTKDTLSAATLTPHLQSVFRAMHVLVGWQWIVVAAIALLAAFMESKERWLVVLMCGAAMLVEAAFTLVLMGVFLGTELMAFTATLFIASGVLLRNG